MINILNIILKYFISNFSVFKKHHDPPRIFLRCAPGICSLTRYMTCKWLKDIIWKNTSSHINPYFEGTINLLISIWLLYKSCIDWLRFSNIDHLCCFHLKWYHVQGRILKCCEWTYFSDFIRFLSDSQNLWLKKLKEQYLRKLYDINDTYINIVVAPNIHWVLTKCHVLCLVYVIYSSHTQPKKQR